MIGATEALMEDPKTFLLEERKQIFITELLRSGVGLEQATEAASILITDLPDEQLTSEQIQLVNEACAQWLRERRRQDFIDQVLRLPIG